MYHLIPRAKASNRLRCERAINSTRDLISSRHQSRIQGDPYHIDDSRSNPSTFRFNHLDFSLDLYILGDFDDQTFIKENIMIVKNLFPFLLSSPYSCISNDDRCSPLYVRAENQRTIAERGEERKGTSRERNGLNEFARRSCQVHQVASASPHIDPPFESTD